MNAKRKNTDKDISRNKKPKQVVISSKTEEGNNSVEYYIKGTELDIVDVATVSSINHIYFYSSITRKTAADLISKLMNMDHDNIDNMRYNDGELRPIHLHILSEGGDIFAALAVYENIKHLKSNVHCHIDGFLSSAAIIIMLACNVRSMSEYSSLGIHSIKMSVWGKLQFLQQCTDNYNKIWKSLETLYEKHTKMKQNKINIKEFMTKSQLIDAKTALQLGFVTHLV
jgi:ATP-dependent protease ClpP protease subunit